MSFNLDIAIFVGFLVVNLAVGLFAGRGIKTVKEYTLGNRNFSTATIAATVIATWLSGASFSITATETYTKGLYFVIPGIGDALSFFIVSYLYAPRMGEFLGKLSIADAMGSIYDKRVRGITVISGIFPVVGNVAMQFSILAALLSHTLGISGSYALIMSSLVIITYSTFGGIKAVTFTDIIQFFTFGVIIPIIAFIIWSSITDSSIAFKQVLNNSNFDYHAVLDFNNPEFLKVLFLFLFFMVPGIDPAIFQRISMCKNVSQVFKSFTIAGFFIILCDTFIYPFVGVLLLMHEAPITDSVNIVSYIADNYLSVGLKGLFITGIVAMIMSTVDSYINSSAVLLAYDGCKCLGVSLSEKKQLLLTKIASIFIALLALSLSLFGNNLLELILSAYSFYMPIVSVPFILAIFGFRSTSRAVLIGMLAGFITVITFKQLSEVDPIIPGMMANIIFFIVSHYILNESGGWTGVKDKQSLEIWNSEIKKQISSIIQSLKISNIIKLFVDSVPKEERFFVYVGLFSAISMMSNVFSLPSEIQLSYRLIIKFLYYSVLTSSTLFIIYPLLKSRIKDNHKVVSILWNIVIFYNLAFSTSMMVIISKFNSMQITIFITSLFTLGMLMRWQIAIIMIGTSILSSVYVYKIYGGININSDITKIQFKFIYMLMLLNSILIAFIKPKQEQYALSKEKNDHLSGRIELQESELRQALALKKEFIRNVTHEYNAPMTGIISMAEAAYAYHDNLSKKELVDTIDIIYKSALRLNNFDSNINTLAKLSKSEFELNKESIDLSSLVVGRVETCRKLYEDDQEDRKFIFNIAKGVEVFADRYYLTQTLDNLIINAITYCQKGDIIIELECDKAKGEIRFTITDEGIGIPRRELYDIFDEFKVSSKTHTPAGGRGVGLAVAKKVIEAHGGKISANSDGESGASFCFVLNGY